MEKLFKIGEVAKFADTTMKTIRYYEKVDSVERLEPEQDFFDNVDIPVVQDPKLLGLWKIYDHVLYSEKANYSPSGGSGDRYFMRSLAVFPDTICMLDADDYRRLRWTKGIVFDKKKKPFRTFA